MSNWYNLLLGVCLDNVSWEQHIYKNKFVSKNMPCNFMLTCMYSWNKQNHSKSNQRWVHAEIAEQHSQALITLNSALVRPCIATLLTD